MRGSSNQWRIFTTHEPRLTTFRELKLVAIVMSFMLIGQTSFFIIFILTCMLKYVESVPQKQIFHGKRVTP